MNFHQRCAIGQNGVQKTEAFFHSYDCRYMLCHDVDVNLLWHTSLGPQAFSGCGCCGLNALPFDLLFVCWFVGLLVCLFACLFVCHCRANFCSCIYYVVVPVLLCFYGIGGGFASCFLRTCLLGPMLSILLYGDPITVASCVGVSWPDAQDRDSCRVGSAVPLAPIKNWRKCKFKAILKPTTQGKFGMLEFNFCLLQLGPDHCTTCL